MFVLKAFCILGYVYIPACLFSGCLYSSIFAFKGVCIPGCLHSSMFAMRHILENVLEKYISHIGEIYARIRTA